VAALRDLFGLVRHSTRVLVTMAEKTDRLSAAMLRANVAASPMVSLD
jgi:hypothetical protein